MIGWDSVPRISEFIKRFTGEEEIVPPGLIIQSDRPEWQNLQGIRLWTSGPVQIAAAVGNRGKVEIPNLVIPGDRSPLIIVVTGARILNVPGVAQQYLLTMDGPAQGTPTANFSRDSRQQGLLVQSVNRIGNAAGGVGGNFLDEINTAVGDAGHDFAFNALPVVIHPGHNVQIWDNIVNTLLRCEFFGYEYNARVEELIV